jgi:hypothetical protein
VDSGDEDRDQRESEFDGEVVPGVPIVRSSTPRPLSLGLFGPSVSQSQATQQPGRDTTSVFPVEAPSAPPLPEEAGESEHEEDEFLWLFEYGLEMDSTILNSSERLDGLASLYGPAVLKGYELTFDVIDFHDGPAVASILPSRKREAEVWGVLYRVPRRLAAGLDNEPALLDKIHSAAPPDGLFERLTVTVDEAFRGREITCITYIASATARNQFHLLPRERQVIDPIYAQRILETVRKQKLPGEYLHGLRDLIAPHDNVQPVAPGTAIEQNTEPLPVFFDEKRTLAAAQGAKRAPSQTRNTGMVIFALYLVCSLLVVFTFAILPGLGIESNLFASGFAPLGIPWFVLVYGLIGGYLSCIVNVGRQHPTNLPNFVLITWFTRPLIGSVLAVLVYLLLNSGLFVLNANVEQHYALYSLLAILAGACESRLFYKKPE